MRKAQAAIASLLPSMPIVWLVTDLEQTEEMIARITHRDTGSRLLSQKTFENFQIVSLRNGINTKRSSMEIYIIL